MAYPTPPATAGISKGAAPSLPAGSNTGNQVSQAPQPQTGDANATLTGSGAANASPVQRQPSVNSNPEQRGYVAQMTERFRAPSVVMPSDRAAAKAADTGQAISPGSGRPLPAPPTSPRGGRSDTQDPWAEPTGTPRLPRRLSRRLSGKISGSVGQADASPHTPAAERPGNVPRIAAPSPTKARSPVPALNLGWLSGQPLPSALPVTSPNANSSNSSRSVAPAIPVGPYPPTTANVTVTLAGVLASPRSAVDALGGRPPPPTSQPPASSSLPPVGLSPSSPRGASLGAHRPEPESPKKPSPGRGDRPVFVYLGASRPAPTPAPMPAPMPMPAPPMTAPLTSPLTPPTTPLSRFRYDPRAIPKPQTPPVNSDPIGPQVSPQRKIMPPLSLSVEVVPSGLDQGLRTTAFSMPGWGASLPSAVAQPSVPGLPLAALTPSVPTSLSLAPLPSPSPGKLPPPPATWSTPPAPTYLPPDLPPGSPRGYVYADYPKANAEEEAARKALAEAMISPFSLGPVSLTVRSAIVTSPACATASVSDAGGSGTPISPRSKAKTQPGGFLPGIAKALRDTASQIKHNVTGISGFSGTASAANTASTSTGAFSGTVATTTTSTETTAQSTLTTTSPPSSTNTTSTTAATATPTPTSTSTASTTATAMATTTAAIDDDHFGRARTDTTGIRSKRSQENVRSTMKMVEKENLPAKLTPPREMAQKFARAETSNFASVATGRANPIYRLNFAGPTESLYYRRLWRPFLFVMSRDLQPQFTLADNLASDSAAWKRLIAKCDLEAGDRGMAARDLNKNPEVRALAKKLLAPVLTAVEGDGKSLLTSVLPPALLDFLLELDFQHTSNWEARSQRLLEQQILRMEMDELFEEIRKPIPDELKAGIAQKLQVAIAKAHQYRSERMADGEDGEAEFGALDRLSAPIVGKGPDKLKQTQEQLNRHASDFREIRHQAMQAFIGIRGLCSLYNYRHESTERPLLALGGMLTYLLSELPLVDRLLDCSKEERAHVAAKSLGNTEKLQVRWRAEVLTDEKRQSTAAELEKLHRTNSENHGTSKKQVKRKSKRAMAAESPITSASKPGTAAPRPKRGSQPSQLQRPAAVEDRLKRRQKTIVKFLEKHGIAKLVQAAPASQHGAILGALNQHLTEYAKDAKRVNEDVISKVVIEKLRKDLEACPPGSESRRLIEGLIIELEARSADDSATSDSPAVSRKLEEKGD